MFVEPDLNNKSLRMDNGPKDSLRLCLLRSSDSGPKTLSIKTGSFKTTKHVPVPYVIPVI